ncbi:hypothetical protein EXIGLDRAFT_406512 [Exidia glandulosa HHB12029]|uniref:Uncharacterized protein n=1 Tax=Exidia glandulosa HHB12029 TaxID=1314781 RepID=A0A165BJ39_EXIGL|nr:hypothetical protein EXIGLDRAFT_406512 [Exidia glandulosa HHB12029]
MHRPSLTSYHDHLPTTLLSAVFLFPWSHVQTFPEHPHPRGSSQSVLLGRLWTAWWRRVRRRAPAGDRIRGRARCAIGHNLDGIVSSSSPQLLAECSGRAMVNSSPPAGHFSDFRGLEGDVVRACGSSRSVLQSLQHGLDSAALCFGCRPRLSGRGPASRGARADHWGCLHLHNNSLARSAFLSRRSVLWDGRARNLVLEECLGRLES